MTASVISLVVLTIRFFSFNPASLLWNNSFKWVFLVSKTHLNVIMLWHDTIYDMIWYNMIWYDMIYDMIWRGKQWQTTPKNLPRMQCTRAIPVAWLSSGLCPNRPKGWIIIIIIIIIIIMIWYDMIWYDMYVKILSCTIASIIPRVRFGEWCNI